MRTLRGIVRLLRRAVERGTFPDVFKYSAQSLRHEILGSQAEYLRRARFPHYPLIVRRHTTDHRVFAQIFIERDHTPIDDGKTSALWLIAARTSGTRRRIS